MSSTRSAPTAHADLDDLREEIREVQALIKEGRYADHDPGDAAHDALDGIIDWIDARRRDGPARPGALLILPRTRALREVEEQWRAILG